MLFSFDTSLGFASTINEQTLKELYGPRLNGVSIDVKYAFKKANGVAWEQSTYNQRKKYLTIWQERLEKELAESEAIKAEELRIKREIEKAKLDKERESAEKLRAEELRVREELREKNQRRRALEEKMNAMKRNIDQLKSSDRKAGE